jgi:spermidine/putrescine transport system permease protein
MSIAASPSSDTSRAGTGSKSGSGSVRTLRGRLAGKLLSVWAVIALAYLFLPIVVIVVFSFNEPGRVVKRGDTSFFKTNRYNYQWGRFSFDAWKHPFKYSDLTSSFLYSLGIAALVTFLAIILGTMMSLAIVKYRFTGKGFINMLLVLPLTMPEVVLGFSLLTLFVSANIDRGFWTIVIAHVMFCVSYVATTVKARIRGFDWRLEEAAADLGASPWRTFSRVTLPIIAPGVAAAALLTFALSLDDFIITYLNSDSKATFPIQVWTQKRSSIPPQINVFGTAVLLVSVILSILGLLAQRRRGRLHSY